MASFASRMFRAAMLDASAYEEVEADRGATLQAVVVVVLSALAAGSDSVAHGGLPTLLIQAVIVLAFWYVWAYLTFFVGTRLLPEPQTSSNHGELLRTIGFASAPGLIRVLWLVFHTGVAWLVVFAIASVWMLVAMVVAVRQALDYASTPRAVVVCAIGWVVYIGLQTLVFAALW